MNLPPFCDIKKPHVYVSVVEIAIRNNDYFRFMFPTKTRLINLRTGSIIIASERLLTGL